MKQRIKRVLVTAVALLITTYIILALTAQPAADKPFFDQEGVMVMAHAGGKGLWPDNTLFAMQQSAALGVDVLEMDIHATQDGIIVVRHDDTVDAFTEGTGKIKEMTFAEIRQLDAGYDWTPDDGATYPFRGQGIHIPSLEEILTAFPNMKLNIEIKQQEPSIAEAFCQLLRTHDMVDQVLIGSFHQVAIQEFRTACPEVATSGVESEIRLFFGLNTAYLGAIYQTPAEAFQVPEYSGGLHVVTPRFVKGAQRQNIAVHVWTVNEMADMERLVDMGVDGIITDYPDRLLAILGRD